MRRSCRPDMIRIVLVLSLISNGCIEHNQYRGVQRQLDNALWYYEIDRQGKAHPISGQRVERPGEPTTTATAGPSGSFVIPEEAARYPARVPSPALVDLDSQIHLLVGKSHLDSGTDVNLPGDSSRVLLKRKEEIKQALEALTRTVQLRAEAIRLFGTGDPNVAGDATDKFDSAEEELIKVLQRLWKDRPAEMATIRRAYEDIGNDPSLTRLYRFLQTQIDAIEAGDRAIADGLRAKTLSLRLEAQVAGRHGDARFLHLEGYDTLEQGLLETRDRWGLDLSPTQRQHLDEQMKATQQVAQAAEALRRKEMTLREAVASAGPFLAPWEDLTKCLLEIQPLIDKYDAKGVREKLEEIGDLCEKLLPKIEERTASLSNQLKGQLEAMPKDFERWVKSTHFDKINELFAGIASVQELRQRWLKPTFADQTALVLDSASLFRRLGALVADARLCAQIDTALTEYVNSQSEVFRNAVQTALKDITETKEYQALRGSLGDIQKDFQQVINLVRDIQQKLKLFGAPAEAKEIPSAAALDVPMEDIRDTFMDLRRTRLSPGDEIILRATLKEGDKEIDSSTASFKVEHLGWYANLSPSVVLAKPTELAGGEDDFRFAPALSWLHHYVPRPEEEGWYTGPLRVLDPALGIHAVFLSFDTAGDDEAIQIGLGGTLSLWKERLQFGAGFNLMADSGEDGRYYFFVGTDLIGLLQTVAGQPAR